jgi:hypothetical protein
MTEREWLGCKEPERMLRALRGAISERKLHLFAAACCRRVWLLLRDERSRQAVEAAENHAARLAAGYRELERYLEAVPLSASSIAAAKRVLEVLHSRCLEVAQIRAREAVEEWRVQARRRRGDAAVRWAQQAAWAAVARPMRAPRWAARAAALAAAGAVRKRARARVVGSWGRGLAAVPAELAPATWQALSLPAWWAVRAEEAEARQARVTHEAAERRRQAELLRELLGNPLRPAAPDPAWLTWGGGTVARIARAIAVDGAFDQTPILADALEEAGCADERILEHLRGPGPHLRGCWALDLIVRGDALQ